jgi:two-component system cell cycle sensor histidine kinase/response regulator CckA
MPPPELCHEMILLVEDNDLIREIARKILERRGYVVIEASNGREGLKRYETHLSSIDLLLTDVAMPELNGRELADGALMLRPELKVMFMSGAVQDNILAERIKRGAPFLQKPFTAAALTGKVRQTLDAYPLSA